MSLTYQSFPFTPVLGWSISRHEVFDKCKRRYFFTYYGKYAKDFPHYKIAQLKELTSTPLEIGNIVHDVIEAFLRRLQKNDSNIDESKFFHYARQKASEKFSGKTFIEQYYGSLKKTSFEEAFEKIAKCLENFISSPCYHWIFMKAITNKNDWLIEPPGFGETRLNGIKAYCKMDFLFPVDGAVHIMDWKTGGKDAYKHSNQLICYAAAANNNFNFPVERIFPKIIYLLPAFTEYEFAIGDALPSFFEKVKLQTEEMYSYCLDVEKNIPLPIDDFPLTPSESACPYCNFQELCFTKKGFPGASGKPYQNPFDENP